MAEYPAIPLWTDAYLSDTGHLTTLEHGAYLLLLMTMWRAGGFLPNDDKKLARFSRLTLGQWERIKPTMMEFFTIEGEQLSQSRLTDELVFVRQRSARQADNARAKSRKDKRSEIAMALPKDKVAQPNSSQNAAPTPTPTPTILDPPSEEPTPLQILSEALGEETAKAVMAHRRAKRSPVSTPLAARGLVKGFREFPGGAVAAAEMMVTNGWTGFKREYWEKAGRGGAPAYRPTRMEALKQELRQRIENEQGTDGEGSGDLLHAGGYSLLAGPDQCRDG